MTMRRQLIWAVALVLATFGFATAQETTSGSITGEVVDSQGAPVPGATVTVTSPQGPKSFVTDSNGRFFAPYLTPGRYAVRVELSGFSPVEQKNIEVRLGQRLELSGLTLKVGGYFPGLYTSFAGWILGPILLKRLWRRESVAHANYRRTSPRASGRRCRADLRRNVNGP